MDHLKPTPNELDSLTQPGADAGSEPSFIWPYIRCKQCPQRIWLPYAPDETDDDDPGAKFKQMYLVCWPCQFICRYDVTDVQWRKRRARSSSPRVMLRSMMPCTEESCAERIAVNVVVLLWDGSEARMGLFAQLGSEASQWMTFSVTCRRGHEFKLDAAGISFSVDPGW